MVMAPGQLLAFPSSCISAGKTPSLTVREDGLQLGPIPLQSASFPRGPAARGFVSAKVQASRAGFARRMLRGGARRTARGSFPCASWWSVARPHLALDIMCYSDGHAAPAEGEQKQLGGVEHRSRARPRWRQRGTWAVHTSSTLSLQLASAPPPPRLAQHASPPFRRLRTAACRRTRRRPLHRAAPAHRRLADADTDAARRGPQQLAGARRRAAPARQRRHDGTSCGVGGGHGGQ